MEIKDMDFGVILTSPGNGFFVKRDETPSIFFQKYGLIWKRFMSEYQISSWWESKYGRLLDFDEQNRLVVLPTQEQLLETLLMIQRTQNHWHNTFDSFWTDERKAQHIKDGRIIPQKPTEIPMPFEKQFAALMTQEQEWKGKGFAELFRALMQIRQYKVSTFLILATMWKQWNPNATMNRDRESALESIQRRREYSRLQMQKMRVEIRSATGFGEHSKTLTQQMSTHKKRAETIARIQSEIESLNRQLSGLNEQQHQSFETLNSYLSSPLTHSESQHDKLKELLNDNESPR